MLNDVDYFFPCALNFCFSTSCACAKMFIGTSKAYLSWARSSQLSRWILVHCWSWLCTVLFYPLLPNRIQQDGFSMNSPYGILQHARRYQNIQVPDCTKLDWLAWVLLTSDGKRDSSHLVIRSCRRNLQMYNYCFLFWSFSMSHDWKILIKVPRCSRFLNFYCKLVGIFPFYSRHIYYTV